MESLLQTRQLGREILLVDECASTNDLASQLAALGARHGLTVIAKKQDQGRGRQAKAWKSPEGGIWMTIILRPPPRFQLLDGLPLIGALGVTLSLFSLYGVRTVVRWPNDVTFQNMKVAGTIAEATSLGDTVTSVLLGIGLNANFHTNQIGFANASTLLDILGSWVDREQLISSILLSIERLYCKACLGKTAELLDLLSEHDGSLGRRAIVRFDRETIEGILKGYQTLTSVRIVQQGGSTRILETSSVISVDYSDV